MDQGDRDLSLPSATAEEEAFKKSTDCVYFLASPLTCKKGTDCEYRHSEGARVNPRDCWFWLNGNCLNPKCSFRHPPLDGLMGTPTSPSVVALPKQATTPVQIPAGHASASTPNITKQSVPCYYFQTGVCLKGDKCAFMHQLPPIANPSLQHAQRVSNPVKEQQSACKKTSWSLNKPTYDQNNHRTTAALPVVTVTSSANPISESRILSANGIAVHNKPRSAQLDIENPPKSQTSNISIDSGNATSRPLSSNLQPVDEHLQNDVDVADDLLHESSPGFDVLVDNENEDGGHFHDGSEFNDNSGHDGRSPGQINDFEYQQGSDYNSAVKREWYDETGEYDHRARAHYSQDRHRPFERILDRPPIQEKRARESQSPIDGSDLRHRLKQRRLNRSKPTSPDRHQNYKREERSAEDHRNIVRNSRKDVKHFPHEGSLSKRLQGRITLPGRVTANVPSDSYSVRNMERGMNSGRASPGRPINSQGRIHNRLHRRTRENFSSEAWSSGLSSVRGNDNDIESQKFSGLKSLEELKGSRKASNNHDHGHSRSNSCSLSLEQRHSRLEKALDHRDDESISFEGPMPLSVILERKRGSISGNHSNSAGEIERAEKDRLASKGYNSTIIAETNNFFECQDANNPTLNDINDPEVGEAAEQEEGLIIEGYELDEKQHPWSSAPGDTLDFEDGMTAENMEDLEFDNYGGGDAEYEYEGEDYKINDDDEEYHEHEGDEDLNDEDDGNDFARKLGVEYS